MEKYLNFVGFFFAGNFLRESFLEFSSVRTNDLMEVNQMAHEKWLCAVINHSVAQIRWNIKLFENNWPLPHLDSEDYPTETYILLKLIDRIFTGICIVVILHASYKMIYNEFYKANYQFFFQHSFPPVPSGVKLINVAKIPLSSWNVWLCVCAHGNRDKHFTFDNCRASGTHELKNNSLYREITNKKMKLNSIWYSGVE